MSTEIKLASGAVIGTVVLVGAGAIALGTAANSFFRTRGSLADGLLKLAEPIGDAVQNLADGATSAASAAASGVQTVVSSAGTAAVDAVRPIASPLLSTAIVNRENRRRERSTRRKRRQDDKQTRKDRMDEAGRNPFKRQMARAENQGDTANRLIANTRSRRGQRKSNRANRQRAFRPAA